MRDRDKDKERLLNELMKLHTEITELEHVNAHYKQTEKKLAKSEELYRLIAESTSDVISLTTFNLHPVFTHVSPSVKVSAGYEPEELVGKSPFEFIHPDDKNKLFPILKNYVNAKIKKLLTGKEFPTTMRIEFRFKDKAGNWRDFQSTGNIVGNKLLFINRDITESKLIEEKLNKSEEQYRTMIEHSNDFIWALDKQGNFTYFNKIAEKISGYKIKDFAGKSFAPILHPEELSKVKEIFLKTLSGKSQHYEVKCFKKNRSIFILSVNTTPIFKSGEIVGTVSFGRDITKRKKAEEALNKSQQEFASLFKSSPEASVYTDERSNILDISPRFTELFGYTLDEIKGRNIDDGMIQAPEKIEEAKGLTNKALKGDFYYETTRKKKDGTLFPVAISGFPVITGGRFKGFIASYRDITERQKMIDDLKSSEEKYRSLYENMPGAYYRTDKEGNLIMINPEGVKLFGYNSSEDILGKNISQHLYFAPEDRKKYLKELEKNKGNLKDFELTCKKKDGTPLIISDTSHFYYNQEGNIAGVEGIFVDITERKKTEEALRKSQKEFASLFKSSPEALVYLDKNGIIVDANLRFCKLFGYSLKEIKGRNIDDGMIHSSNKIKEGKKLTVNGLKGYLNYETIRRKKDGTLFPVSISATPLVIDGQAKGEIGIYIDITERKQSEEALNKSQQEFSSLFKSSPEALIYIDEKSKILDINSQFTKLFGYALKEIKGKNIDNGIIHSQKMIREGKSLTKKALEGFINYETIRKRKDGSEFPVFISSSPVKINNKSKGIITLYQDITERRKAEEKLRQSEEKFAGIFKNIPDVAFYLDTEGIILDVNPNFTRLLGYTKKEILGKNIDEVGLYPKGKMKEGKDLTRKILNKNLTNFETIRRKKDGTPIPVHISTSLVKIKDKVTGIIALYHDITERKQSEKIQKVVYNISKAANSSISLGQLYPIIHQELGNIIDTTNFYIALADKKEDNIFFPYHVDEKDNDFPILNFSTSNTLTTYVIKTGKPLLNDNSQYEEMVAQGILTTMGTITDESIWLGVPLKIENRVIGAMAVQSYTNPNLYSESDIKLMEFVSSQVATAIERKSSEEKIKHLSFHDALTGLYNRAYFEEELERYNFPRYYPLSIVMLDVNGLKVINDTFGHSEGDRLLQHLSQTLTSVSRQGDILARIGGDEFAILLPSTSKDQVYNFCQRIKKACQQDKVKPIYLRLNISLGHATQEGEYKDINSLFKVADRNMYQDKLFNSKSREKHFLEAFRIILAERDPHTEDHAQRLQELALSLGRRVGLTEYQLGNLKLLALLHDIGKIGIPDSILFKTYILTPSEWKKMREHSRIGYRMAKNIPDFSPIAQEILYHHEHWDGTGYPDGLKGEDIPLLSRIISIVDAYDVMQSRRPYKGAVSKTEALKEIKRCAGTQFDPQLVEIFLKIENDKK